VLLLYAIAYDCTGSVHVWRCESLAHVDEPNTCAQWSLSKGYLSAHLGS
jgi:hypothetical protein